MNSPNEPQPTPDWHVEPREYPLADITDEHARRILARTKPSPIILPTIVLGEN